MKAASVGILDRVEHDVEGNTTSKTCLPDISDKQASLRR
jgi:hypothetical protein